MLENNKETESKTTGKRFGCLQVLGLTAIAVIIAVVATIIVIKIYFFPSYFKPVNLSSEEKKVLVEKLENLGSITGDNVSPYLDNDARDKSSQKDGADSGGKIEPEPYSEEGLKREVTFTERELNGLLANNTELAKKLAIDLSDDLISAKLILPVDEDFPVIGGKILRLKSGLVFSYDKDKPVVILKGVTIMGVPVPNAWLGGIKNIDLVEKFGAGEGFWKIFSDGVEDIRVEEGILKVKLKE
ncbi:MAG: arginine N-succinyltransferase [Deltaproteobacteria bacterium]|nr:arginine N-succinyltransferase [Deltaproteobacteria bacterium]